MKTSLIGSRGAPHPSKPAMTRRALPPRQRRGLCTHGQQHVLWGGKENEPVKHAKLAARKGDRKAVSVSACLAMLPKQARLYQEAKGRKAGRTRTRIGLTIDLASESEGNETIVSEGSSLRAGEAGLVFFKL